MQIPTPVSALPTAPAPLLITFFLEDGRRLQFEPDEEVTALSEWSGGRTLSSKLVKASKVHSGWWIIVRGRAEMMDREHDIAFVSAVARPPDPQPSWRR